MREKDTRFKPGQSGNPGSEGMVPEAGAWTGFVSKTLAARPIVIGYPYEKPDRYHVVWLSQPPPIRQMRLSL